MQNLDKNFFYKLFRFATFFLTITIFLYTFSKKNFSFEFQMEDVFLFYIVYSLSIMIITLRTSVILHYLKYLKLHTLYQKIFLINISELFYSIIHPIAGYTNRIFNLKKNINFENFNKPIILMVFEKSFIIFASVLYLIPTLILFLFDIESDYYFIILLILIIISTLLIFYLLNFLKETNLNKYSLFSKIFKFNSLKLIFMVMSLSILVVTASYLPHIIVLNNIVEFSQIEIQNKILIVVLVNLTASIPLFYAGFGIRELIYTIILTKILNINFDDVILASISIGIIYTFFHLINFVALKFIQKIFQIFSYK